MAIMKFMCGMRLDSPSPQSFPMCVDQQMMATYLPKNGIAQTCYSVHIADIKMPIFDAFSKNHVLSLFKFSKIIKLQQKTRVALKWLNSLRDVISNTNNFLNAVVSSRSLKHLSAKMSTPVYTILKKGYKCLS